MIAMLSNIFFLLWIGIAVVAFPFCCFIAFDAYRDIQVREMTGINHGRETLARLLVVTASLTGLAFFLWIVLGLFQLVLYRYIAMAWVPVVTPVLSILSELALAGAMIYKQIIRRRVLRDDMASKRVHDKAEAVLASAERRELTEATKELTVATQEQTAALHNGPLQAQLAQTEATADLTTATTENTEVIKISTEVELRKLDGENG